MEPFPRSECSGACVGRDSGSGRPAHLALVAVVLLLVCAPITVGLAEGAFRTPSAEGGRPGSPGLSETPLKSPSPRRELITSHFNRLPTGPITPGEFSAALGGAPGSSALFEDTSVVRLPSGRKALRVTLDKDTIFTEPAGARHGLNTFIALPRPLKRACLRYRVRFSPGFDWSLGGKLPGLLGVAPGTDPGLPTGGKRPGSRGWSGRVMWLGPAAFSMPGRVNNIASYMYGPTQAADFGDNVFWDQSLTSGTWHTLEQCYAMNTVGRADGVLRAWFDGHEVVDRTDYVYRTRADVGISHLVWSVFRGGNTLAWASPRTGSIDFQDVRVTRGPIPA